MRGRIIIGIMALAVAAAVAVFYLWPSTFDAVRPRVGPAVTSVYASGTVEASVMLPVAPRVGARLISLDTDEQSTVRKGQVLGRLESADLASNIAQLKAQAQFAQNDLGRDTRLLAAGAVARQVYDRALADWRAAEAAVRQAEVQAGFMTLVSPDNCIVIQRDGELGQFIAANTPVFWLSCRSALRISALVDEEDIPMVAVGQKVFIRADAFPGRIFEARVTEVTPKGDPIGRSYRVRITLPPDCPLQIGMTTESNILIRTQQNALLLPASAVVEGKVWKIVAGRAVRTAVRLGAANGQQVQIVQGLSRDDVVLRDANAAVPAGRSLHLRFDPP